MRLEDSVTINRPPEEVWAFYTDWFNAPRIGGGDMLGLRQTSPGPTGIGSTLQGRRVILGFEARIQFLITEWDPPRTMASSISGRALRSGSARTTLEAVGDGTRFSGWLELELRPAWRLLLPIVGPVMKRNRRTAYANLKRFLESQP
ncbi:MAG: SRPBCC family protein [Chloroflexota bacterium]